MDNDKKMVELLADMLHELKVLSKGQETLNQEVKEIKSDLLRMTNAFWEQSQMLQKVIWEPAQQQAQRISTLEERVSQLEQAHG